MAFPKRLLEENEEVVLDKKPHVWFVVPAGAALLGTIVVGLVTTQLDYPALRYAAGVLILGAMIYFAVTYVRWSTTNFVVTTERLIFRQGFFSRRGTQMSLDKINTVDFSQSLFERMIGAGDLKIEAGSETGVQRFSDVAKPLAVQQEINRQREQHDQRERVVVAAPVAGVPEQIRQLASLVEQGLLSPAEFEAKKNQLLDRM